MARRDKRKDDPEAAELLVEQVEALVAEAEDTARQIREEAEAEAQAALAEHKREADAQLRQRHAALVETMSKVVDRVAGVKEQADLLSEALGRALPRLRELMQEPPAEAGQAGPSSDPTPRTSRSRSGSPGKAKAPEEAILAATTMTVSGKSREEMIEVLRAEHGVDDPELLLDEILEES